MTPGEMQHPPPINAQPLGILGFLGIKNGGRYPQHFGDNLQPVWDLSELYLDCRAIYTDDAGTIAADGEVRVFTVPEGELWYVSEYTFYLTTQAGDTLDSLTITRFASGPIQWLAISDTVTVAANFDSVVIHMDRPRYLQSGEGLGFEAYGGAYTGTMDWQAGIRYTRLTT